MMKFFVQWFQGPGAWCMWAILVVMSVDLAMIIERVYFLVVKSGKGRAQFMINVQKLIKAGDMEKAVKYSSSFNLPLAKTVTVILQNKDKGQEATQAAIDETFLTEVPRLQRYTPLLMIIANISTLLGLLGTIYGLVLAFDAIANVPAAQRATALAVGISIAMGTTLFGLIVAIPTMLVYGVISQYTDRLVEEMDEKSTKLINILFGKI
jgi:biopolymer transport protein ExbB